MKEYTIGQVLFVLLKGETSIHPLLVVEELRKKTLQGVTTEYTVEVVSGKGKKVKFNLSELEAIVFDDIASAKAHLLRNATEAIDNICNVATSLAEKWLVTTQTKVNDVPPLPHFAEDEEEESITLENGVKARVILPPNFAK